MAAKALDILNGLIDKVSSNTSYEQNNDKYYADSSSSESLSLIVAYTRSLNVKKNQMNIPMDVKILCNAFYGDHFNKSLILKEMNQRFKLFQLLCTSLSIENINKTKLLYRLSRDGYDSNVFINKLKDNAPYIFLIKTKFDSICGGYSKIECSPSTKRLNKDLSSFLFILESPNYKIEPQLIKAVNSDEHHIGYYHKDNAESDTILFSFGGALCVYYREAFPEWEYRQDQLGIFGGVNAGWNAFERHKSNILSGDPDGTDKDPELYFDLEEIEIYTIS